MTHRLPPLNALKAFEAAARHLSVKQAADELSVTPGAVSQSIRTLEAHLGVRLFERIPRGLLLSAAGRDFLPSIRAAFRQIAEATRRLAEAQDDGMLTVSVTPFFGAAWLVPRLDGFRRRHPDIDLAVVASTAPVDFGRSAVDVAVRHGLGRYPGLRSDRIVTVEMVVVGAPALVEALGRPRALADLLDWPLVHGGERSGWRLWFTDAGIVPSRPLRGFSFDDTGLLMQAVLAGHGAGLLPAAMVEPDLAAGRLVKLVATRRVDAFAYYLVCPAERQDAPKIQAFRQWVIEQGDRSRRSRRSAARPVSRRLPG